MEWNELEVANESAQQEWNEMTFTAWVPDMNDRHILGSW